MADHAPNLTKASDAIRPILEQCLASTKQLLEAAKDETIIKMYERRVVELEELLR